MLDRKSVYSDGVVAVVEQAAPNQTWKGNAWQFHVPCQLAELRCRKDATANNSKM
jgi:hypothetical protein